jgi:hypothetical protein
VQEGAGAGAEGELLVGHGPVVVGRLIMKQSSASCMSFSDSKSSVLVASSSNRMAGGGVLES